MANSGQTGTYAQNESSLLGQLQGSIAPQTANAQLQYNLGQNQIGLQNTELGQSSAYSQAMSGYQAQNLGLSEQSLGIQGLGLQQQGAQSAAQQGIEEQQYGLQQGQYPEQSAEAALAYQNAMQQTQGGQAISGTQNTVGGKQAVSTEQQQYGFQQEDIARAQAQSQLGQKSEESGYQYSNEELANAQKNLSLSAQANGLSEQQMMTMLNYGNTQQAEGAQGNILQLLSQQGNNALGNLSNVGAGLSPIGFSAGVNAQAGVG